MRNGITSSNSPDEPYLTAARYVLPSSSRPLYLMISGTWDILSALTWPTWMTTRAEGSFGAQTRIRTEIARTFAYRISGCYLPEPSCRKVVHINHWCGEI